MPSNRIWFVGKTMHAIDERVEINQINQLKEIYTEFSRHILRKSKACLIIMAKEPLPGQVKTRLAKDLERRQQLGGFGIN